MNSIATVNESQKKASTVAGISFLLSIVIMIVPFFAISLRLMIPGDAVETAQNIIAQEGLFRINIVSNLVNVVNMIILITVLYVILKPVNKILALIAACFRMIYALMWAITTLNMLIALRILKSDLVMAVFKTEQLQTLARMQLSIDAYYIGLPFWALASLFCCYLWLRSNYIPRFLAGLGIISSAWAVFCSFAFLAVPNFKAIVDPDLYDFPLLFFEIGLGIWLLAKGLKQTKPIES